MRPSLLTSVSLLLLLCACPPRGVATAPVLAYNAQALALMEAGDLVQAEIVCEHCLEFQPDNPECLTNKGLVRMRSGDRDGARRLFIKAIRVNQDLAQAWNNLGVIELDEGDLPSARHRFEAALRVNPDYAEARHNLGLTFLRLKDLELAERAFRHLIASAPQLSEPYLNLGAIALMRERPAEAVPWFERALSLEAGYAAALKGLAAAQEALGRRAEAHAAWADCVAETPGDLECSRGEERTRE